MKASWVNPLTTAFSRLNFTEYAVLDAAGTTAKHLVGNYIQFYVDDSCQASTIGDPSSNMYGYSFSTVYRPQGDNQTGTGTTKTSLGLQ